MKDFVQSNIKITWSKRISQLPIRVNNMLELYSSLTHSSSFKCLCLKVQIYKYFSNIKILIWSTNTETLISQGNVTISVIYYMEMQIQFGDA